MKLRWSEHAWEDYLYWQQSVRDILHRVNAPVRDIGRDSSCGIGKPEPLRGPLPAGGRSGSPAITGSSTGSAAVAASSTRKSSPAAVTTRRAADAVCRFPTGAIYSDPSSVAHSRHTPPRTGGNL